MYRVTCLLTALALCEVVTADVRFRIFCCLVLIPFVLLVTSWHVKAISLKQGLRDQAVFVDLWWLVFAIVIGAILEASTFQSFGLGQWWIQRVGANSLQHILFVWLLLMIPMTILTISLWRKCTDMWAQKATGVSLAPRHSLACHVCAGLCLTLPCDCLAITLLLFWL